MFSLLDIHHCLSPSIPTQAGLQPRDPVEVLYESKAGDSDQSDSSVDSLNRIISGHADYIQSTTKGPVRPLTPECDLGALSIEDEQKVWSQLDNNNDVTMMQWK